MDVIMPQLGETVAEGTVTKWYKKVGDTVKADETLFDVETDKVSTEIPSPVAGVIQEIRVGEGITAKVGVTLAVIAESGTASKVKPVAAAAVAEPASTATAAPAATAARAADNNRPRASAADRLSPVVRRLIAERHLDVSQIKGSGRDGRITRDDVIEFMAHAGTTPAPQAVAKAASSAIAADSTVPLNAVRKRVA